MIGFALWLAVVLVVATGLTGAFIHYAQRRQMLDVPNDRSSHSVATPRGGGGAIVVAAALGWLGLAAVHLMSWAMAAALLGSGVLVAAIGFADDRWTLSARVRLISHFAAAAWVLVVLGRPGVLDGLSAGGADAIAWVGAAVGLVWMLNLTNFMDGIDGIAAIETVTAAASASALAYWAEPAGDGWRPPLVLAVAALGFLRWNWAPARVFMGDTGSGFLGLMLGALALYPGASPRLSWAWAILLGVFIVDTTVTLLRRMARRERVHEAHRSHAFQHAALRWRSHKIVSTATAVINLVWLLPVAACVVAGQLSGPTGLAMAYLPLVIAALRLGAGVAEPRR